MKNPTLKATGFAHHPYTKKTAPTVAPKNPEEITIANIGTLGPLLDTLAAQSGGKIAADLPIFLTEFGYESEPDPRNGIPLFARRSSTSSPSSSPTTTRAWRRRRSSCSRTPRR